MGVLAGIANPAVADVPAAFRRGEATRIGREGRGREEETRRIAGDILNSTIGGKLGALGKANPNAAVQLSQALGIPLDQKGRIESMVGDIQVAATIFETAGPEAAAKFTAEKAAILEGLGIQPDQYLETIQGLTSQNPEEVAAAGESLIALRDGFIETGLLKGAVGDKSVLELRKEVRADLRKQVKDVSKQTSAIQTNFKKIQGLTTEISKGNRNASAAAIIALVKLGEPDSTVREGEMIASLNNPNPLAATISALKGIGTSDEVINSVTAAIDPLSPGVVNVNSLLSTANALVGANVPSIQSAFAEAREQGDENLTARGVKSIFTTRLIDRVGKLSDLVKPVGDATVKPVSELSLEELQAEQARLKGGQ